MSFEEDPPARRELGRTVAAGVAAIAMLVVGIVYVTSGLVMPGWAVAGMLVIWLLLLWYGVRLLHARSYEVLLIPLVAAGLWLLVLWLGGTFLDWTA